MLPFYAVINFSTFLLAVIFCLLITFRLWPLKKSNIYFVLMLFAIAGWCLGIGFHALSYSSPTAIFWSKFLHSFAFFIPVFYFGFISYHLNYDNNKIKLFLFFNYLLISALIILLFTTRLIIDSTLSIVSFSFFPKAGFLYFTYILQYCLCIFSAILLLAKEIIKFRNTNDDKGKKQQIYLLASTLVGFTCAGSTFIPMYGISVFPYGNYFTSLFIGVLTYAILKHELMDIKLIIKKGTSIIFTILFLSTVFSFIYMGTSHLDSQFIILLLAFLLSSFFAIPFRDQIVTGAKHVVIKNYYKPGKVISSLAKQFHGEQNREVIFRTVTHTLFKTLQTREALYCFANRNNNQIDWYIIKDAEGKINRQIPIDSEFIQFFQLKSDPTYISDLSKEAVESLGAFKLHPKQTLFLPFHSPEILEGIIILSEKESGQRFNNRDFDLFNQLQVLLLGVFYKLTPYEKIERAFHENQRKLHEAETALIRAQKIQAVSRAHKEVQHELRTPASIISMTLENYHNKLENLDDALKVIGYQIKRQLNIIDSSLGAGSGVERPKQNEDVHSIIEESLQLYPLLKGNITLTLCQEHPVIFCAKGEIISVLINLIKNAETAMPNGGDLIISTEIDSNEIVIRVSDTGHGILPENMEKIWEPYFTTELDTGHGLGLSISHNIIQQHQGSIKVESEVNKGTKFSIRLPLVQ